MSNELKVNTVFGEVVATTNPDRSVTLKLERKENIDKCVVPHTRILAHISPPTYFGDVNVCVFNYHDKGTNKEHITISLPEDEGHGDILHVYASGDPTYPGFVVCISGTDVLNDDVEYQILRVEATTSHPNPAEHSLRVLIWDDVGEEDFTHDFTIDTYDEKVKLMQNQANVSWDDIPPTVSMLEYGYMWGGMVEVSKTQALKLFDKDCVLLHYLYDDGTENAIEGRAGILQWSGKIGFELDRLLV